MNVGEWVHFANAGSKVTGYIIAKDGSDQLIVQTTIPDSRAVIVIAERDVVQGSSDIWLDDIPVLIDLSLKLKDEEWFKKWVHELRLWKPIESILTSG